MSLFAEFERRDVILMVGLYLVGAWLIVQVAEPRLPILHTPERVLQALVALFAAGLVPALFCWLYQLTPEGLRRPRGCQPVDGPDGRHLSCREQP